MINYTIDDKQEVKLKKWKDAIKEVYGNYGDYEYRFKSCGIGMTVTVYSDLANTTLDLTDVDNW